VVETTFLGLIKGAVTEYGVVVGVLLLLSGVLGALLWRSNNARLVELPTVVSSLDKATRAAEALERRDQETNKTREGLVAALADNTGELRNYTGELRSLAYEIKTLSQAIEHLEAMLQQKLDVLDRELRR
jgi:septal ring factor EnvC (AmiA/AmiB activator)